jgi:SulP family sulfate permease
VRGIGVRRGDLIAGLSVAVLLIPQALAYAEIAGMPAVYGLYAAALPPIVAALLASSRHLQTGPVAMTALLTFGALSVIAEPGSDEYIELAILLALVVGVIRLVLGLLRAGIVAYLMSQPVLVGFTSAVAILITASQIPTVLGVSTDSSGLLERAWDAVIAPGDWEIATIGFAVFAAVVIIGGRRLGPRFPGVVVAVVVALIASQLFDFAGATVAVVPEGLPPFTWSFPWGELPSLIVPGIVIALLGFAEPAAIARTFAAQEREPWDPNREFLSQGVANIASALSSGFPVGGSFSRSGIARLAGGETRWTGAVAGLTVFAFLPIAGVLEPLPRAVLGTTVIVAVVRLIRITSMVRLIKVTWGQSLVAWVTFIATLVLSPRIDIAVIIGVGVATAVHLRREALIRVETASDGTTLMLKPHGVLYFGSAPRLSEALIEQLASIDDISHVVVDLGALGRVDYTGAVALKTFVDECGDAGLRAELVNVPLHATGTLTRFWGDDLAKVVHPD